MKAGKIEWTNRTWNPVRGCSRVSEGCRNCYAERQAARFSEPGEPFHGFVKRIEWHDPMDRDKVRHDARWTGKLELAENKLLEPITWRRPSLVFVNSMSDLFHESLDKEAIDRVFAAMIAADRHHFQVLTKRAERMHRYMAHAESRVQAAGEAMASRFGWCHANEDGPWPPRNVWLGVSVEDQVTADARIPLLLDTPAAVRFVSYEPALGPIDFGHWTHKSLKCQRRLDWIIVGGESGPNARPCELRWIRSVVEQCKAAGVACFVKQLGAKPFSGVEELDRWPLESRVAYEDERGDLIEDVRLRDRKGGDPDEWPKDLRVRQFPNTDREVRPATERTIP